VKGSIKIDTVFVGKKPYDGGTSVAVDSVRFSSSSSSSSAGEPRYLAIGSGYTATAAFEDSAIGTNKPVTATVTLLDAGYILTTAQYTFSGQIDRAKPTPEHFEFRWGDSSVDSVPYDGQEYYLSHSATAATTNPRAVLLKVKQEYEGMVAIKYAYHDSASLINAGSYPVHVSTFETATCDTVEKLLLNPFIISKATPTVENILFIPATDTVYDGNKHGLNSTVTWNTASGTAGYGTIGTTRTYTNIETNQATTTAPTNAGDYAISVDISEGANYYAAKLVLDTLTIAKKAITVDSIVISAKTYDGTDTAKVTKVAKFGGLVNISSNTLTLKTEYVVDSARFEDTKAGTSKKVKVYVRLTGGKAVNYVLDTANAKVFTQNVAQKKITSISAVVAPKTYDGTDTAIVESVTFNGILPADSLLLDTGYTVALAHFDSPNVSTKANKKVTVQVALAGVAAENYTLTKNSCTVTGLNISKATPDTSHLYFRIGDSKPYSGNGQGIDSVSFKEVYLKSATTAVKLGKITPLYNGQAAKPSGIGKYAVTVNIAESTNFEAVNNLPLDTFVITPGDNIKLHLLAADILPKHYDGTTAATVKNGNLTLAGVDTAAKEELFTLTPNTDFYVDSAWYADAGVRDSNEVFVRVKTINGLAKHYLTDSTNVFSIKVDSSIYPKPISIADANLAPKTYDGTDSATVDSVWFTGLVDGDTLRPNVHYTSVAAFTDSAAGSAKTVNLSVALKDTVRNYTLSSPSCKLTGRVIAQKEISIDTAFIAKKSYDGTTKVTVDSVRFKGLVDGDTLAKGTGYRVDTAFFDSITSGATRTVTIRLSLLEGGSYKLALADSVYALRNQEIGPAAAAKKDLYFTPMPDTMSYNGKGHPLTVAWSASATDTVGIKVTYSKKGGNATATDTLPVNVGTYYVFASVSGAANFGDTASIPLDTFTIVPDTLTITGAVIAQKTYDGTDTAKVSSVEFSGKVVGPVALKLGADYKVDSARFDDVHAGTEKDVALWVSLTDTSASANYVLGVDTFVLENQNIAQRPIQLVAAGLQVLPKFYDGTRYATIDSSTVKFSNLVEGDTLRWTVERAEFNDSIAKSGKSVAVTISLIPDSVSSSYTLTKGTATLTKQVIGKAHLTADMFVALDSSVTYDSKVHAVPKPALKPDVPGVISFTLMYGVGSAAPATAKPKDAGKHLIYAGFKGNTNYAPDTIVVDTFTIKPCPIAINKVTIGKGKSYDGTDTLQVGNVKSVTFTGLVGSQKITADGYTVDSARFVDKNAGDNKDVNVYVSLKADGSIAKNYVLDSNYIAGKIGISKREITIDTAFLAPKVYSGSDSSATVDSVRFGNLVAGDTLKLDVDYTALARYTTIDVAGGSSKANVIVTLNEESETAKNYTLSDTLYDELKSQPISRAAIKIASVSIKEKVYDGTDTAVVESITVSDTTLSSNANGFTLDTGDYTLISSTFDSKNAGSGKTLKVAIGLTEKGKEKYTLADTTYTLTGQSIGKATPAKEHFSVTLAHDTVTYGGDAPDFGLSVAWKPIYSDTGSFYVLYDGEPYSPYNVGKYYISLSVEGTDNFEAGVVDVDSVVIRPKEIAVDSAIIKAKTYNGTIAATVSEVIFTGLVPEDALDFETGIADGIYKASAKFDSASVVGAGNAVAVTVWLLNDHHLAKNYTLKGANSKGRVTDTITGQTISKKALTIASDSVTIVGKPYDGTKIAAVEDDTLTIDEGKFAGLVGNDTVYVVVDSARYSSASVSGATKVYVYATPYGKNADSYTVKTLTLTLAEPKIAKDTPSVAHLQFTPKDTTYVYGEKVAAVAKPKLKTGLSGAGTIGSVLYGNETYSDTTARPKDVGKYLVKVAVGGGANFEAGTVVFDTITIVQDTLNITGFAAKGMSKAYDGTDTADARKVTKVTFTSTRAGKAVSISTGHYVVDSAKFSSKNVSGDSTVTIYVSLNPDSATSKNYVLRDSSYSKMLDTIKQKPIDVSGATLVAGRVYNGTTAATADVDSVAFTGVVPGDTLALGADYAVDSAFFDDPAAGADKTLSVYVSLTGNAKNYRLRSDSIVLENQVIPKRTIYFDSIFVAAKVYDGTDTAKVDSVKFANLVAGDTLRLNDDYSVASARFSRKNAGDSSLTVSISLADSSKTAKNYQLAHADTTISRVIAKATPAPEHFDITGADAVYDGAKHAVTVAVKSVYEGFGTISGPNYLTGSTSTTTAPTAAGAYAVWVKVTKAKGGANFESADTVHVGTLTIAKKTISVDSVVFAAKTYDGTDTAKVTKVAKFGGLTSGSTLTIKTEYVVDSARFADTNAGANKDVKVYVRLTGTGKSANYVLDTSVVTLKHSVAQRKTTLSRAAIAEKTYDGTSAAKADSVFFSNVLPADSLLLDTGYTVVRAYFTNVNAGTNNRTATVKVALTGPAAVNYVLTKDSINVAKQTIKKTTFARDSFVVTGNRIAVGETLNVDVSLKAPYADLATVSWIYTNLEGTDTIATPAEAGQYLIVAAVAAKTAAKANINDFNGVVDTLTIIAAAGGSGSSLVAGVVPPPAPRPLIPETPTPETPTPETPTPETPTPETPTPETPTPETPIPASDPDVQATADVPSVLDAIVVSAQEEVQVVEVTGDTIYYTVPCGKNVSDLQVTFDKNGAATSTDGDTLKVDVSSAPSLSDIPFAFTLNDGEVKEYTLRVEKPFDFSSIVHVQLGGRMLLVVKNPESNGGYDLEKAIWQRKVGDEWWNIDDNGDDTKFFYVSPDGKPITDTIRVLLQDSKGDLISTCPYDSIIADTPGAGLDDAQVYPNPVTAGGTVKLQLGSASPTIADLEKIYTRVYFVDIMGTIRLQGKLSDLYSGLTIPDVASGTYLLVLEGPSARKNFKLTVE
jgi:hypothetical protein